MKIRSTPWADGALTKDERGELRVMLSDEYVLYLSATSPRGPWRAAFGTSQRPPSLTGGGNLATAWSAVSPKDASMRAIRMAAGDLDEDSLARQLAASLRAIGIDPTPIGDEVVA